MRSSVRWGETDFSIGHAPASYWNVPERRYANIKGQCRRKELIKELQTGMKSSIPDALRVDEIPDVLRGMIAELFGPSQLGGEDLPPYLDDEVEIARIAFLRTVHCEVTSLRARNSDGFIRYRAVDELEGEYDISPDNSAGPLTLQQLIALLDGAQLVGANYAHRGLFIGVLNSYIQEGSSLDDLDDFLDVSSVYYPEIAAWYHQAQRIWKSIQSAGDKDVPWLTFDLLRVSE